MGYFILAVEKQISNFLANLKKYSFCVLGESALIRKKNENGPISTIFGQKSKKF
jgi:hypothetical protein